MSIQTLRSAGRMRTVFDNVWALYELARLAALSRFRFRGAYWRWRLHTAFGCGYPRSRVELLRALLAYGRWMHRMRRH
jgi:hypothetical protein